MHDQFSHATTMLFCAHSPVCQNSIDHGISKCVITKDSLYSPARYIERTMLAAASRGCTNIVSALLSIGTDPNYCEDGGDPALFVAIEHGHIQVRLSDRRYARKLQTVQLCAH